MSEINPVRKFLFDRSFEDGLALEITAPPSFTQEQLEAARQEGHNAGFTEGQKALAENQQQYANVLLAQIDRQLGHLIEASARRWDEHLAQMQEVALVIARKILPAYVAKHGLQEIEAIVTQVIKERGHETRLVVRVSEAQFDTVNASLKTITEREAYAGKIVLLAEPEFGPADCRVEWADGGMERDLKALWQEIDSIMERAQSAATPLTGDNA